MKKIFTILSVSAAMLMSAQTNLVTNPGFESWDAATDVAVAKPTGWTFISTTGATQETSVVHSGSSSFKTIAPSTTGSYTDAYVDVEASENTDYSLGYWILDNDANARGRIWVQSRSASANITWSAAAAAGFQPSTYSSDSEAWTYVTSSSPATTPAGTTILRFDLRTYAQSTSAGSGTIYYDDVTLVKGTLATGEVLPSKHRLIKNSVVYSELIFATKSTVQIYDMTGKLVKTIDVQDDSRVDVSNFPKGTYIVRGLANGSLSSQKFIKQ